VVHGIWTTENRVDDEGKYLPKNFGGKAPDGREKSFLDFYGLQETCATELEGRYGLINPCSL
jgi:hypothetical protein